MDGPVDLGRRGTVGAECATRAQANSEARRFFPSGISQFEVHRHLHEQIGIIGSEPMSVEDVKGNPRICKLGIRTQKTGVVIHQAD